MTDIHSVVETCSICDTEYCIGIDGVDFGCDKCLEITRDLKGYPWKSDEMSHVHIDFQNHTHVITREQAFGNIHFYYWDFKR